MPLFESLVKCFVFDSDGKYFSYPIKKDFNKSLVNTEIKDLDNLHKTFIKAGKEFIGNIRVNYPEVIRDMVNSAEIQDLERMVFHIKKILKRKKFKKDSK